MDDGNLEAGHEAVYKDENLVTVKALKDIGHSTQALFVEPIENLHTHICKTMML